MDKDFIKSILDSNISPNLKDILIDKSLFSVMKKIVFNNPQRTQEIVTLIESGKKLQEVGDVYGVTRERIRQVYKKATGIGIHDVRDIQNTICCEFCGKEFVRLRKNQKLCSYKCREEKNLYKFWSLDICEECGFAFLNYKGLSRHKKRFCSKTCQGIHLGKNNGFGKFPEHRIRKPQGKWSMNYDQCVICKSTKKKHYAKGECVTCYHKKRYQKLEL